MIRPSQLLVLAAAGAVLSACATSAPSDPLADRGEAARPAPARRAAPVPVRPAPSGAGGVERAAALGVGQYAQTSPVHRTLAAALIQAQLTETLSAAGPFTLFAPTDAAFNAVPVTSRSTWLQDAGRPQLQAVLRRHLVPGRLTAAELTSRVQAGGGAAALTTVAGDRLTVRLDGGRLTVTDSAGGSAVVTSGDLLQPNGVVHVVDRVLLAG